VIWHVIIFAVGLIFGVFLGILVAKRNPRFVKCCNALYLKLRGKAATTAGEILDRTGDEKGSTSVSPVSANALMKYLLRFGIPLAAAIVLTWSLKPNMVETMLYKCCLIFTAYALAELIWVIGYKRTFDRKEKEGKITDVGRIAILVFRGLLFGAVIVGLTQGL
jgi:hypothetical protein